MTYAMIMLSFVLMVFAFLFGVLVGEDLAEDGEYKNVAKYTAVGIFWGMVALALSHYAGGMQ